MFSCSIEVQRQCNSKSRTFTLPAGYGNRTAFIIDDIFDDGKSQSGTFDMLADDVLKEPGLNFNPRQGITKEDVLAILEKAY